MSEGKYKAAVLAAYLEGQGAEAAAAKAAGRTIAETWNDRYFFRAWTYKPLEKCVIASPAIAVTTDELLEGLIRHCGVFVHQFAWEPH